MKICTWVNDRSTFQLQITSTFQEFIRRSLMNINSSRTRSSESWIRTCQCLSADRLHEACLAFLSHEFYVSSRSYWKWECHSDRSDRIYADSWTTCRWYSAERMLIHWLIQRALLYICKHWRKWWMWLDSHFQCSCEAYWTWW